MRLKSLKASTEGAHDRFGDQLEIAGQHQHIRLGRIEQREDGVTVERCVDHPGGDTGGARAIEGARLRALRGHEGDHARTGRRTRKVVDQRLQVGPTARGEHGDTRW
jgi:hypothetical protein